MAIGEHGLSSVSSASTYLHHNDLDLDSLFRRLDKYTAELEEVEARFKGAHRASDELSRADTGRFSFEDDLLSNGEGMLPVPNSRRASSQIRSSLGLRRETVPAPSRGLGRAPDHTSEVKINESRLHESPSMYSQGPHQSEAQVEPDWPLVPTALVIENPTALEDTTHVVDRASHEKSDCYIPSQAPQRHWTLPPRTSSRKGPPVGELVARGMRPTTLHRRALTVPEQPIASNDIYIPEHTVPPSDLRQKLSSVPGLSHAGSTTTLNCPPTPLLICSPGEDQLRRELESFALREGAETLKMTYKNRKPPMLSFVDSDGEEEDWEGSAETEYQQAADVVRIRRQRSFLNVFQRKKSAVEQVIDMYLDDIPVEKPMPKRSWSTKLSRSISGRADLTKSPPIPALPQSSHGRQQVSVGRPTS
ncbi:hypothetical protein LTR10_022141 [Elasticomyces elasticus]|uniref:Uncharacterized protein n=1 Tax=Exophiala sideris TaxID=1016849 RepID=A0ABR0J7U6_9EURO|nr:hypothetical protein LTR10_022141 [Elasticomyces elasticus]KAK5029425.1 hypothetical protein LTS07_005887 [Exophiala sideris]KAK5036877.1 hypothetical protein LTR13_005257 [Exophiala sideris]KAK5058055.1 hypothetical protein LTR69_007052 [Exophiala sideris]KAK5182014.1 hypothetical protein LTR44_005615 [Eurotiomycetes sp. CCFEE 6388]